MQQLTHNQKQLKGISKMAVKIVTTRKTHPCANPECRNGHDIDKGSQAKVVSRLFNRVSGSGQYFETYYFHVGCPIRFPEELF